MSDDPMEAQMKAFLKKPLREQLDLLVKPWRTGVAPAEEPWLTLAMSQALMIRKIIESSYRLEGLTKALIVFTIVLAALTAVLAYDVVRHLIGN